jgi:hypothetical protein
MSSRGEATNDVAEEALAVAKSLSNSDNAAERAIARAFLNLAERLAKRVLARACPATAITEKPE